jgi:hypothetical protein
MFKRLFIGLIILSALTTEGLINTSWNIYNLCVFVDSVSSFSKESDRLLEQQGNSPADKVSFTELLEQNKLLTESEGIGQIKYNKSVKPVLRDEINTSHPSLRPNNDRCTESCSFITNLPQLYPGQNRDIILCISDTSPPSSSL